MPLKLLQVEQEELINKLLRWKAIVLNRENNQKDIQLEIANGGYTHVFISSEIAISTKFKKNILESFQFMDYLYLFAVNKIHLIKECGKSFQPLYAEIEKF